MGKHNRVVRQNSGHLVHECGIESDKDAFFSSSVELPTCKLQSQHRVGVHLSWGFAPGMQRQGEQRRDDHEGQGNLSCTRILGRT